VRIISTDNLHRELIEIITAKNNDYLLVVKNNYSKLLADLKTYIQNNLHTTENITTNKGHDRLEKRQIRVFDVSNMSKKWRDNLTSIIELKRTITRKGKIQETTQYYISSKIENAQTFNEKIREHWAIENQLHWVKDVIFNEDNSGIHDFQPATNLSILTTIAMNLYRCWGFKSIKKGMRWLEKRMNNLFIIDDFFDDISQKPA
jgi:predicted transposase YbfD/YdcC